MSDVINGVPRELLERVAKPVETQYDRDQRWKALVELRALLTAQPQATTRADGANISEAPVGFKRPTVPPPAPPRSQASAAQSAPVIDLDANAWEGIKQAASESEWIPAQYFMGDWVADVCEFLRSGRAAQSAPAGAVLMPPQCTDRAQHVKYRNGWNSCLSEVARLNRVQSMPENWKPVPVKPTIEMVEAGYEASLGMPDRSGHARVIEQYDAMLAACKGPDHE